MGKKRKQKTTKRRAKRGKRSAKKKAKRPSAKKTRGKSKRTRARPQSPPQSIAAADGTTANAINDLITEAGSPGVGSGFVSMPFRDAFAENYKAGSLLLQDMAANGIRATLADASSAITGDMGSGLIGAASFGDNTGALCAESPSAFSDLGKHSLKDYMAEDTVAACILDPPDGSRYLGSAIVPNNLLSNVGEYVLSPEAEAYDIKDGLARFTESSDAKLGQVLFDGGTSYQVAGIKGFTESLNANASIVASPALDLIRDANRTVADII